MKALTLTEQGALQRFCEDCCRWRHSRPKVSASERQVGTVLWSSIPELLHVGQLDGLPHTCAFMLSLHTGNVDYFFPLNFLDCN